MKYVMIEASNLLQESARLSSCRLVAQIHDEVLFTVSILPPYYYYTNMVWAHRFQLKWWTSLFQLCSKQWNLAVESRSPSLFHCV